VEFSEKLADAGKTVIIAALDATFQRKPFGRILELVPMSEKVTKLTAICIGCGAEAPFTQRFTTESSVELVGGQEMYRPLCRECFKKPIEQLSCELSKPKCEPKVIEKIEPVKEIHMNS